jgi:hypothetical protein
MKPEFSIPPGWQVSGELPSNLDDLHALGEDIIQFRSLDGDVTIDVGWYPELDPDGMFRCVVVRGDAWKSPEQKLTTTDLEAVRIWISSTLARHQPHVLILHDASFRTSAGHEELLDHFRSLYPTTLRSNIVEVGIVPKLSQAPWHFDLQGAKEQRSRPVNSQNDGEKLGHLAV